ncbi:M56 family metallopeptidase [Winogradskyella ursingii]|uniref:M56 family metallopeptidase n=1 Tax=Winogradskyella ursingii TaxID=2686079 RepID=UPI0015C9A008|nr:M56 family metallopeptidase [Winogradskyella ursingii]
MDIYLLKFSGCLLAFWLLYALLLEKQSAHQFKRFYLLGAIAISLLIPTMTITEYIEPVATNLETVPMVLPTELAYAEIPIEQASFLELETVLWLIYGLGVLLFSIRFMVNFFKMYRRITRNQTISKHSFIYVLLKEYRIPHSFFNYIFLNKLKFESQQIPKEVMLHEETHAKQLHSIDILVLEVLQIVFWFHPLIYILKHHIKLNHEFLADQAVLNNGINAKAYQNTLLQFSSPDNYQLSSAINYSSIKKRFTVMKTQTSKTRIWLSSLILLPIIAILFYSFAETEYVEKEASQVSQLQNQITNAGATEAMMLEYKDWIKKLNTDSSGLIIPVGTWERLAAIYDLMSEEQRNSVDTHPLLQEITPDLYSVTPSEPTAAQFKSWKNEEEFAIWLDGKHISNSKLNNYSLTDIAHFRGSKAHKNARSEKFPQPFQINLYTKDGFYKFYKEAFISDYRGLTETYSNAIKDYLKGPQTDNSELRIIKAQADKFYGSFTKEEKEKHNILPAPPVPAEKQSSLKQSLNNSVNEVNSKQQTKTLTVLINRKDEFLINDERGSLESLEKLLKSIPDTKDYKLYFKTDKETSKEVTNKTFVLLKKYDILKTANEADWDKVNEILDQQKATKKQIADYNAWAKRINNAIDKAERSSSKVKEYPIIKQKDFEKFERIYKVLMSQKQRENAEPWPNFSNWPPPPPPPPAPERATVIEIAEYDVWAKKMNMAIKKAESGNNKSYYPRIKKEDYDKYYNIFSNLMTEAQRETAEPWPNIPPPPPPPPPAPETPKVIKGGKDNPLPPPPPPPAPQEIPAVSDPIEVNGVTYYFSQKNGKTTYYDEQGNEVDINKIPPPPPIPKNATPEQKAKMKKATDAYMKANPDKVGKATMENGEVIDVVEVPSDLQGSVDINGETFYYTTSYGKTTYYNKYGKEVKMDNLPPPPPPKSAYEFVKSLKNSSVIYYYRDKKVSYEEILKITKDQPNISMQSDIKNSEGYVKFWIED